MAITKIHEITSRLDKAVGYCISDKVEENRGEISDSISYAVSDKTGAVTYKTLNSTLNCDPSDPVKSFNVLIKNGKENGIKKRSMHKSGMDVVAWHLIQSFDGMEVPPMIANEIGLKLAKEVFGNFACTISTHTNEANIHNHIMICAWDMDARKWNNSNENYARIREVSDRLCEEYGLKILRDTQEVKLIVYTDRNGTKRKLEPTERKLNKIRENERGNIVGDVTDFRNYPSYENLSSAKESNREAIRRDIDNLLPTVSCYDELLYRLRELGYTVNDKKVNGDWLEHISFTAPFQDKPTRDSSLGDGVFYTREVLSRYIEDREREKADMDSRGDGGAAPISEIPYQQHYEYGMADIDGLNADYRLIHSTVAGFAVVRRNELERGTVGEIKKLDIEVKGLIDTSGLERIIAEQRAANRKKIKYTAANKAAAVVVQINNQLRSLRIIEKHGVHSLTKIKDLYGAAAEIYGRAISELSRSRDMLAHLREIQDIPAKYAELKAIIETRQCCTEYMMESYYKDSAMLENYYDTMCKYGIASQAGMEGFKSKIGGYSERSRKIRESLAGYASILREYEDCIAALSSIEQFQSKAEMAALSEFEAMKGELSSMEAKMGVHGER